MKVIPFLLLAALALPSWWSETNSHAANARGVKQWARQQYAAAAAAFERAQRSAPSSVAAFNLGTAEIAAGERERGSSHLEDAIRDPALRADALFNRGNSALAAKALDHAVRDYIGALKANPSHAAAKRNLEIALRRRDAARRAAAGGQKSQKGESQGEQQPAPASGKKEQPGEMDLQSLLRSVQQQEQEELRRMKGRAAEGRVGW